MDDRLKETGRCVYAAIDEMVTALNVDYERLNDLTEWFNNISLSDPMANIKLNSPDAIELHDLRADAGDCENREDAECRIHEDALSIEVRSGWRALGDTLEAKEFNILITTGGPAVRIMGELDDNREPARAWLEVQDWGTPWTRYYDASQAVLLAYARCFYFGE